MNRSKKRRERLEDSQFQKKEKYWDWDFRTKVVVVDGEYKGKSGEIGEHDPLNNQFMVYFEDETSSPLKPSVLRKVLSQEEKDELEKREELKEAESSESFEDEENLEEEEEEEKLEEPHPVEIEFQEQQEEIKLVQSEAPRETLLRLAKRKNGVTLAELSQTRCLGKPMVVKGPFKKTMNSAFKRKLITKKGSKRGGEDVYVPKEIEDNEFEAESSRKNMIMDSISSARSANELGDIFIAVGRFLKNL